MTSEDRMKLLGEWYDAVSKVETIAKPLVERERALRAVLAQEFFPSPVEGSKNKVDIQDGWGLKLTYSLDRKVDEPALELRKEEFLANGINVDALIRRKPELITKNYRELSDAQRRLFDTVLEIKPQSPQLEVLKPKGT